VLGWSCDKIAKRYSFTRQHIWQIVSEWKRHAVALGYVQVIPPAEVLMPMRIPGRALPGPGLLEASAEVTPRDVRIPVSVTLDVPLRA
jgi:hypothetical protein